MDAFQCRMQFTRQLQSLNASSVSAKQCAQFALKNREYDEDLVSVIVEQLQSRDVSMNVQVNILYFIETLCEQSLTAEHHTFVTLIQRELPTIVGAVASEDPEGAANVETVKTVLQRLKNRGVVDSNLVSDLENLLAEREVVYKDGESSEDDTMSDIDSTKSDTCKKRYFTDTVIQQRMEEDRERHKRLRENIWQIQEIQYEGHDPEFDKAWELASDLASDDFEIMKEEREILIASIV
ncbi:CTD kinase subunit gamma CTK3-domain-containing protein [Geopyxis carbonaria]|nr:CTD kinase subunit gamma CTK3-domain-containing protein [Geopyxis carbonaria]